MASPLKRRVRTTKTTAKIDKGGRKRQQSTTTIDSAVTSTSSAATSPKATGAQQADLPKRGHEGHSGSSEIDVLAVVRSEIAKARSMMTCSYLCLQSHIMLALILPILPQVGEGTNTRLRKLEQMLAELLQQQNGSNSDRSMPLSANAESHLQPPHGPQQELPPPPAPPAVAAMHGTSVSPRETGIRVQAQPCECLCLT